MIPSPAVQRWIRATAAILVRHNGGDDDEITGFPATERQQQLSRSLLRREWRAIDRSAVLARLRELWFQGASVRFELLRTILRRGLDPALAGDNALRELAWIRRHDEALGTRGMVAWDCVRLAFQTASAYRAGFLDERELWAWSLMAAQRLQATLHSWSEVGDDYVRALELYFPEDVPTMTHVVHALVTERDGPWSQPWDLPLV